MKYLDVELMNRMGDPRNKEQDKDDIKWEEYIQNYASYFETLRGRLPKEFCLFFSKEGMHDSILVEFKVVKRQLTTKTCFDVYTLWELENKMFSLTFKDVKCVNTSIDLTHGYCEFGDFIIGEFLAVDDKLLSFEFLFYDCDNVVKIVFKKLSFRSFKKTQ